MAEATDKQLDRQTDRQTDIAMKFIFWWGLKNKVQGNNQFSSFTFFFDKRRN